MDGLRPVDRYPDAARAGLEQGLGALWATHLVDEAEQADRVVVLDRGKVLQDGDPAALVDRTGAASLADAFLALTGTERAA